LAVPCALTGGVYLVWLLDYNFSVAVWVGFIALFGTAVQTGMIMVIYLEDAVARATAAAGGALTRSGLRTAVMEGALLRLRPKVMTVSTVVAGLMPIMWSSSAGAEVMRPLAAPVLGGMVSSLLHVLVVTPVIFYWLRARHLKNELGGDYEPVIASELISRRSVVAGLLILGVVAVAATWWATRTPDTSAARVVVHEEVAGDVVVRLVVDDGREGLSPGRTRFVIEFTDAAGRPVEVNNVRVSSSMTMPGMVMTAPVSVEPAGQGRVSATAEFSMSGAWRFTVEWTGSTGAKSVVFDGDVR
jgi:Cu(I)/Ag(I) efflux system membrane protein CusA/SilA